MSPRAVMTVAAVFLGCLGLGLVFAPAELGPHLGLDVDGGTLAAELAGAGFASFALLDWMGRGAIYGGIYGRPIALGNMLLGVIAGATFAREATGPVPFVLALLFAAQAIAFGWILFAAPPSGGGAPTD